MAKVAALECDRDRLNQERKALLQNMRLVSNAALIKELETEYESISERLVEIDDSLAKLKRAESTVQVSEVDEIDSALLLLRNFGAIMKDPEARNALPSFFRKLDLRIALNFKEGRKGPKRTVRVLQGGVLALMGGKLPIDLHGRDRVDNHTCDAGSEIVTPTPAVLAENGDIVSADGQILSSQGRERRQDKKEAGDDESSPANESRMDLRPNEGVSSTMLSRGDGTPIERFLNGLQIRRNR